IDRLLEEVLGWPIKEPERYKYELRTQAGRPDITLIPERGSTVFLEAKRFGGIKELAEARYTVAGTITPGQMALPGMAVDRSPEEQQAINYAFENGGEWAILTNFERLRLFNARRDWLVLSFERPHAYLDDFDLLTQLSYENVLTGSLDRLNKQRVTKDVDTDYLNFINHWREKLAQDVITHRAQNTWAFAHDGSIKLAELRAVVQRFLDRLVLVRYAEDHLVVDPGTLRSIYELHEQNPYTFTLDEFLDRFFRRFDEAHNSALFVKDITDEASFSDALLSELIAKLYETRYRSMPADIMGNTYEQYLGKALALDNGGVKTRDNLETRKKQGSYYTPQVLVRYLVDSSLGRVLYGTINGQPDGAPVAGETRKTSADIRDLRVLDSACGSGSFLIYAYQVLARFYESEIARLEAQMLDQANALAAEDTTHLDIEIALAPLRHQLTTIEDYPRLILETHLYGVDLDPQAAEIATVNLIMRAMEGRHKKKRLPLVLNQNIKVGNGLIGLRAMDERVTAQAEALATVYRLRAELVATSGGPDHDRILDELAAASAMLGAELDAALADHFTDLGPVRPFHWGAEFPEVFYRADGTPLDNPGFAVVIGNPPWEIVKPDLREYYAQFDDRIESKLNRRQVEQRIDELNNEDSRIAAGWAEQKRTIEHSAAYFRICQDYKRQGRGDTATHKLFMERMYGLLQDGGRLGYLVPSGIYTDLGTKNLRLMLLDEGHIQYIFSFSNERFFFPGGHWYSEIHC
ncbi:Eco57I restriction-modification methylase domain-containing protein, partial [Chloroflexota bacterium]